MRRAACCALILVLVATALEAQRPRTPRRQDVTPELERSAFADSLARTTLRRARIARLAQDSALRSYDAKSYLRLSVGLGIRRLGPERLLMRTEQAARVQWARGSGVWIEPTARRTGVPMGGGDVDFAEATPIPYFPGREALWIPSAKMRVVQAEVDENDMLHPLALGAEAYYRYATGDSISIRLGDGRPISLRELRITARRPEWRAFVGSFWFDVDRGDLVRAAYRFAAEIDLWQMAGEDWKQQIADLEERVRTDTGAAAQEARRELEKARGNIGDKIGFKLLQGTVTPARANLSAVTVEFGFYAGRFWLPKINVAEGEVRVGFMRMPITWQESFQYNSVNGRDSIPPVPIPGQNGIAPDDTLRMPRSMISIGGGTGTPSDRDTMSVARRTAIEDSMLVSYRNEADSLRTAAAAARARGETERAKEMERQAAWYTAYGREFMRRREQCAHDSTYYAVTTSRYGGAVQTAIRMPCDVSRLARSTDLPGSIYGPGEELFGATQREDLLKSLGFSLQPGWGPQRPVFETGLGHLRYNRIEGLSFGGTLTSVLGLGYTASAKARIGTGDWVPNGELSLSRSNGRDDVRLAVFHRLGVANDDWGTPLSVGASLANALYARDEGFYYRTWGAELAGTREATGIFSGATILWRAFVERQRTAGIEPNTQGSLGNVLGDARFRPNIDATRLTAIGAGAEADRTFGVDPTKAHFFTRLRVEGALTDRADSIGNSGYGRFVADATLFHDLGPFAGALTGAAGTSVGSLPIQRAFYVGGLNTVRGQFARLDNPGNVGDAFWLTRTEVGLWKSPALRPSLFYDAGWAGKRADFTRPGRPLSGAGIGLTLVDGSLRFDAARGISPEKRWRFDLSLGARF